jgi:hypothetical protein
MLKRVLLNDGRDDTSGGGGTALADIQLPGVDDPPTVEVTEVVSDDEPPVEPTTVEVDTDEPSFADIFKSKGLEVEEPATTKPVDSKEEDTAPVTPVVTPQPKAVVPAAQPAKIPRDFTGLSEDEIPLFKSMSNDAFNRLKPLVLEHKAIKQRLSEVEANAVPSSYFAHPEAVTLLPDYKRESNTVEFAKFESNYWADELAKIERGEEWQPLGWDDKAKRYVKLDAQPASTEAKIQALTNLNEARAIMRESQGKLQHLVNGHQQRHTQLVTQMQRAEHNFFPMYAKPENPHQPLINQAINAIPAELRGSPLASWLGKAYALITYQNQRIANLNKQLSQKATVASNVAKAGPNNGTLTSVPGGKDAVDDGIDFDAFLKAKQMD